MPLRGDTLPKRTHEVSWGQRRRKRLEKEFPEPHCHYCNHRLVWEVEVGANS